MIFFHKDVLDSGKTWWESFSNRQEEIQNNKDSMQSLRSIQNFYESFCTSRNVSNEQDCDDNMRDELITCEDVEDEEFTATINESFHLVEMNEDFDRSNTLVANLSKLRIKPGTLNSIPCPETVSYSHAVKAVKELEMANCTGNFTILI